jgi:tetratricopeptide (TPR) repeat protein
MSYRLQPELAAILAELTAGRPVLVLHNYGLPVWPRWHYGVVVGYDGPQQRILLRSGKTKRQSLSAANFMRAWDNGDRWAMVLLHAGELPAAADKERYMEAAAAFERVAPPKDAWAAFDAAVKNWPDEAVALVGRGTASYASADLVNAANDYRAALAIDPAQAGARNNLAMTLLDAGCPQSASREIDRIDATGLPAALAEAVIDTRKQIAARTPAIDAPSCAAP